MPGPNPLSFEVLSQLWDKPQALWVFDWDGTLIDLAPAPDQIAVPHTLLNDLALLSRRRGHRVAIVSGRQLADLMRWGRPSPSIILVGNHGLEFCDQSRCWTSAQAQAAWAALQRLKPALRQLQAAYSCAHWEDKRYSVTVHVRHCPEPIAAQLGQALTQLVSTDPTLHVRPARKAWEIRPQQGGTKADAVDALERLVGISDALIIMGDDWTDEDAFSAYPAATTVIVGSRRPTHARYAVESPEALRQMLHRMVIAE
jgi:trehalose 6-phosphate phosphatase